MIVNGKVIAADILAQVKKDLASLQRPLALGILFASPDFATKSFIAIKEKRAAEIGATLVQRELPDSATTDDALAALISLSKEVDGVIVQLPLPKNIDTEKVLSAIPADKDVDGIGGGKAVVLSPVVAAIKEILTRESTLLFGKKVVVVGKGRLVGAPAADWFEQQGAEVTLVGAGDTIAAATVLADVILLGVGSPGLLTPEMIKQGVMILDAGTSESAGKLTGDADPACEEKTFLFTPVPGGIGPIAVAMIFKNLVTLAKVVK